MNRTLQQRSAEREMVSFVCVICVPMAESSIWIKNIKSYGPASTMAGKNCLAIMTKYYFRSPMLTRSKHMMIAYARDLTLPAENIQRMYLLWVHEAILEGELTDMELQLVSNFHQNGKARIIQTHEIYEVDYYLLVMDDIGKFDTFMRNYVTRSSFNPGAKFIILCNNPNDYSTKESRQKLAFRIFKLMYDGYNAANVIFMHVIDAYDYDIYVTEPYENTKECGSLKPILLDLCMNGTLQNNELTKNWTKHNRVPHTLPYCTFKFCAQIAEPYVNDGCTTGLELKIIEVLKDELEFNIDIFCTNMSRGEPYGNGSWSGMLGMLRNDQCDFVVGGFYPDFDVYVDFGVTITYLQDAYTWFVFVSQRQPEWLAMLCIFEEETWALSIAILIISGISWYFFGRTTPEKLAHKDGVLCMLNSWCVFIGVSTNNRPNFTPLRIFFLTLTVYALNLTTIYTSKLIRVFTHPALDRQIDTIEELIDSKIPLGGREEYADWFENDNPHDIIIGKLYNDSEAFWPLEENFESVKRGKRIILTNRNLVLSKSLNDIFAFPTDALASPLQMFSERGFPLLKRYSTLLSYMIDGGIISKLHSDFIYDVTVLDHIRKHEIQSDEDSQIVLTLNHMDGAFTILLLGAAISFVTFIGELCINWYITRRNPKRLWKLLRKRWRKVSIMSQIKTDRIKNQMNKKKSRAALKLKRLKNGKKGINLSTKTNTLDNNSFAKVYNNPVLIRNRPIGKPSGKLNIFGPDTTKLDNWIR